MHLQKKKHKDIFHTKVKHDMMSHNTLHDILFHQMKAKQIKKWGLGSRSIINYSYNVASFKTT